MKLQQRALETKVSFLLWLALVATQLLGVCSKAAVNVDIANATGVAKAKRFLRTAGTSGRHKSGRIAFAGAAKNSTRPQRIAGTPGIHESGLASAAVKLRKYRRNAVTSGSHKPGRTDLVRASEKLMKFRRRNIAATSASHKSGRIALASASTNSTRFRKIAGTSGSHKSSRSGLATATKLFKSRRLADTESGRIDLTEFDTHPSRPERIEVIQVPSEAMQRILMQSDNPVLMQRSSAKFRRASEPVNVEETMPLMFGIPKMVWVILADVLAMVIFVGCTFCVAWADKVVKERGWGQDPYSLDSHLEAASQLQASALGKAFPRPELEAAPRTSATPSLGPYSLTPSFTFVTNPPRCDRPAIEKTVLSV